MLTPIDDNLYTHVTINHI